MIKNKVLLAFFQVSVVMSYGKLHAKEIFLSSKNLVNKSREVRLEAERSNNKLT